MKNYTITALSALAMLFFMHYSISAQTVKDFKQKLPPQILLWQMTESEFYDSGNLHEYINGGAELYLSYGFKQLYRRKYEAVDEPSIYLDIFDMADSKNAFAVFSHSRERVETVFGQGSQYTQGLLLFWKNNFLISILASPETAKAKEAIFNLAQSIQVLISEDGDLPSLISILPQVNLREESIRYFYHYVWLNSYFFIANENILNINDGAEAVLARYDDRGNDYTLLLIKYSGIEQAEEAEKKFISNYIGKIKSTDRIQNVNGKWTCWVRKTKLLAIVFNADSEEKCATLLQELDYNLPDSNDKDTSDEE